MKNLINYALVLISFQLFILYCVSAVEDGSCAVRKCNGRNSSTSDYARKCRCDSECANYGDCCIDAPFQSTSKKQNSFECARTDLSPTVYIKRNCDIRANFSLFRLRRYCRFSKDYDEQVSNYTYKLPVTASNGITYGNKYCAICNNARNYTTWNAHFSCESHNSEFVLTNMTENFNFTNYIYNDTLQNWITFTENKTEICKFSAIPSPRLSAKLRKCRINLINSCPTYPNGTGVRYSKECAKYTSTVQHTNGTYFKNEYCALCNNISSSELKCRRSNSIRMRINQTSASVSSTTSTSTSVPSTTATSTSATSTSTPTTRIRITAMPSSSPPPATNNTNNVTTQVREFLQILVKGKCNDILDSLSMTKLVVETKSFKTMKRTYIKESNLITAFPKRICKEYEIEENELVEESETLKYFVNFGIFVSIFFTSSHLFDFLFSITTSTSTQRIFASYSITLLIANAGFLASNTIYMCQLLGPITYFAFLASFFWLSALSFDIACKTWRCVQKTDKSDTNCIAKTKKFTTYSLISWIFPVIIIFFMSYEAETYGDFTHIIGVYESCWFPEKETFVIFFTIPLIITISINFAFWIFSAYVVWPEKTVVVKLFSEHGIDFKFHTGLIITSNLMWFTALIGVYSEHSFPWVCFACLDAILGLLVYLCSPFKRPLAIKIAAYFNQRFLPVGENEVGK